MHRVQHTAKLGERMDLPGRTPCINRSGSGLVKRACCPFGVRCNSHSAENLPTGDSGLSLRLKRRGSWNLTLQGNGNEKESQAQ
jgi:hypothetical protein